ncbi:hypothetical protein QQP08_004807 [Theobroma cacao]|nr:hypothetical protein QQP08_004807 [Theobroma cacao]
MIDIPGSLTAATFHLRNYLSKDDNPFLKIFSGETILMHKPASFGGILWISFLTLVLIEVKGIHVPYNMLSLFIKNRPPKSTVSYCSTVKNPSRSFSICILLRNLLSMGEDETLVGFDERKKAFVNIKQLSSSIPSPVINLGRKKETISRSEGLNTTPGAGGWNIIARVGVRTRFSCFGKESEEVFSVKRKQNALFSEVNAASDGLLISFAMKVP